MLCYATANSLPGIYLISRTTIIASAAAASCYGFLTAWGGPRSPSWFLVGYIGCCVIFLLQVDLVQYVPTQVSALVIASGNSRAGEFVSFPFRKVTDVCFVPF